MNQLWWQFILVRALIVRQGTQRKCHVETLWTSLRCWLGLHRMRYTSLLIMVIMLIVLELLINCFFSRCLAQVRLVLDSRKWPASDAVEAPSAPELLQSCFWTCHSSNSRLTHPSTINCPVEELTRVDLMRIDYHVTSLVISPRIASLRYSLLPIAYICRKGTENNDSGNGVSVTTSSGSSSVIIVSLIRNHPEFPNVSIPMLPLP